MKRKEYKIEITCADEQERNILFDIIREHKLITTLYDQDIDNENFHSKHLALLSNTLTDNLYQAFSGRVNENGRWTNK
jgi:hypothetical protein